MHAADTAQGVNWESWENGNTASIVVTLVQIKVGTHMQLQVIWPRKLEMESWFNDVYLL